MKGNSFLTLLDYSPEQIKQLLALAAQVKREKKNGIFPERLKNKNIVLIFEKTSTRTRCAFETAGYDEGARVTFLSNSQMGKRNLWKIPQKYSEDFMMESNSEDSNRKQ